MKKSECSNCMRGDRQGPKIYCKPHDAIFSPGSVCSDHEFKPEPENKKMKLYYSVTCMPIKQGEPTITFDIVLSEASNVLYDHRENYIVQFLAIKITEDAWRVKFK